MGAVGDAEKGEQHIAANEADGHDDAGVDASPVRLLATAFFGHALRQADEERELRKRIGDH